MTWIEWLQFSKLNHLRCLLSTILIFQTGCVSTQLTLQSNPVKTEVYVKPLGSTEEKKLGETPLFVEARELESRFKGSGPVIIEFRKEGFRAQKFIVTELSSLDLDLNVEMLPTIGTESANNLNEIVDSLFESQRLARSGRYQAALELIEGVRQQAPYLSAVHEIQGGIYYLQKKYIEALDAYRQAVRHNPKNAEARRMKKLLEMRLKK